VTVGIAGSPVASERLGRPAPPHPEPLPERSRPGPTPGAATDELAAPRLERATHFLIHELLAAAPELGRAPPSGLQTVAAYQAQLLRRIHYSGPVTPVDLRVRGALRGALAGALAAGAGARARRGRARDRKPRPASAATTEAASTPSFAW
jgi:hypothetical protein